MSRLRISHPLRTLFVEGYTPRFSRSDIRHSVNRREMLWIRRKALGVALRQWVATILLLIGIFSATLLPFTRAIAITVDGSSFGVQATLLGISGLCLWAAIAWWYRVYRGVIPGLLLQIDRCGFCGNGLNSRHKKAPPRGFSARSATCTECGAEWSPSMRIGFVEGAASSHRHAA